MSGSVDGNTRRITRRGMLASVTASAVGVLAGCTSSDGGEGDTTTANDGGGGRDSIIPGEVVHNDLSGIEVLDHWVEDWLKVEIQNNREEKFQRAAGWRGNEVDMVRGRVLTEQGNKVTSDWWGTGNTFGPGGINPDTSATIGVINLNSSMLENAARYELCLYTHGGEYTLQDWEEVCSE